MVSPQAFRGVTGVSRDGRALLLQDLTNEALEQRLVGVYVALAVAEVLHVAGLQVQEFADLFEGLCCLHWVGVS